MLIRHSIDRLVFIDPHPFDGFTAGHLPDHLITLPDDRLADLVRGFDVYTVDRTVWIPMLRVGLPMRFGVSCRLVFVALIIAARRARRPMCCATMTAAPEWATL